MPPDPNKQRADTPTGSFYPTFSRPGFYGAATPPDGNCIDQAIVDALGTLPQYFTPITTPQAPASTQAQEVLYVPAGTPPGPQVGFAWVAIATPSPINAAAMYGAPAAPPGFDSAARPLSWAYLSQTYTADNGIGSLSSTNNPPNHGDTWDDAGFTWELRWRFGTEFTIQNQYGSEWAKACGIDPTGEYGLEFIAGGDPGPWPGIITVT